MFENKSDDYLRREVTVTLSETEGGLPGFFQMLGEAGAKVSDFDFERPPESTGTRITFGAQVPVHLGVAAFVDLLRGCPGVQGVQVRRF